MMVYDSRPSAAILSGRVPAPRWPPWTTPVGSVCTDSWSKQVLGEGPNKGHTDPCCSLERGLLGSVLGPPLLLVLFWLLFKTFKTFHPSWVLHDKTVFSWRVYTENEGGGPNACWFLTTEPVLSLPIQPKRVVSPTTIVGNMIFRYTLCQQCNPSVPPVNVMDCGLSHRKTDMWAKVFPFLPPFFLNKAQHIGAATERGD